MTNYEKGYQQALTDINTPKLVITPNWDPSKCPACSKEFYPDYESCYDGYYSRPSALERCPFCGQKLKWREDE